MGTNYYWIDTPCPDPCTHCQQVGIHIGKSSAGWCFALHVDDECRTLADWDVRLRRFGSVIQDEYGRTITRDEMIAIITNRGQVRRSEIGGHCIGHGEGTWDYIVGEFS